MIELITGLPGNGKTLYALNRVKERADKESRPVYYSGISDLALPWIECDPQKWMDCPPNSIIVIDECQRVFRPRMHGTKVPDFVEALETHRHKGVDIVLITQHPMLVDSNVRRLVGLHFHVVRKFGTQAATVHEWGSVKENCDKNRDESTRHEFKYPKDSYSWYKSAEVHTHKARIPARVWVLLAVVLAVPSVGYYEWRAMKHRMDGDGAAASSALPAASVPGVGIGGVPRAPKVDPNGLDQYKPRVPGLAYTAPVYDKVTQPTKAPYPAACVQSKNHCQCYSQQATKLDVPADMCGAIVQGGYFLAWDERRGRGDLPAGVPVRPAVAPASSASDALGGPVALTTSAPWKSLQLAANDALFGKASDYSASDGSTLRSMRDATPAPPAAEPPPERHAHLRSQ